MAGASSYQRLPKSLALLLQLAIRHWSTSNKEPHAILHCPHVRDLPARLEKYKTFSLKLQIASRTLP